MSGEHHKLLAPPALAVAHTASGVTEIVRDVRDLVGQASPVDDELVAAAVRGWSHNTRRAFRSDLTIWGRSEEHTSELQSLMRISYAVFCLKKKKMITSLYIYVYIIILTYPILIKYT